MNKNSNKSKLSKKLKFISVASAITVCVVTSTGGTEASASMFRSLWGRFTGWFSSGSSTSTTTTSGKLNRPSSDARTSTTTTGGSGSVWGRLKKTFGFGSSTTQQGVLKTTDLDEADSSSQGLWPRFKSLFTRTSGNNTTSNQNKSGVTNQAYTPDTDETPTFNPKNDDQNLANLDYLVRTSKPGSSSTSGEGGVQYASLDFKGNGSSNIVHGGGEGVIYATIKPPNSETTGSTSSSSSSGSGGGRRPIPTPRTKNLSSSLQTSSTGSNDGNNVNNITAVLTSKTQGSSNDSQSSSSNSTGPVIVGEGYGFRNVVQDDYLIIQVVPPATPVRPKGLGKTNYTPRGGNNTTTNTSLTTTGGASSSSIGPSDQTPPRSSLIPKTSSIVTIGGSSTSSNTGGSDNLKPKMVTFKSE